MKINRRSFLISSSVSLMGSICLGGLPKQIFGAESDSVLKNTETFRNLIGSSFTLYLNDSAIESVLSNVTDQTVKNLKSFSASKTLKTNSYRLVFSVSDENLPQNFYQIFHPSIGLFNLLLVPGLDEKNRPILSAVINRM